MQVAVFGAGYVGLVSAAGFAESGHTVIVSDSDGAKITRLRAGELPIHEAGLLELVQRNVAAGRLAFSTDAQTTLANCDVAVIAVATPALQNGRTDFTHVEDAARTIAAHTTPATLIVNKSTAPAGTAARLAQLSGRSVAANPEFLREGTAVHDVLAPDRIVLGCDDADTEAVLRRLYAGVAAPLIVTTTRNAELIKYASNAFLALKISFANEIAAICDLCEADAGVVLAGAGADPRIGTTYLEAGLGFGGSCLPKDVRELRHIAAAGEAEPALLPALLAINERQIVLVADRIDALLGGLPGTHVAVLGLAFKPGTDDVREAPAIALIRMLLDRGATVTAHDPAAMANARTVLGERIGFAPPDDPYAAAGGADAIVIATEWNAYRALDLDRLGSAMTRRVLIDARNAIDPQRARAAGFRYAGIGRGA